MWLKKIKNKKNKKNYPHTEVNFSYEGQNNFLNQGLKQM